MKTAQQINDLLDSMDKDIIIASDETVTTINGQIIVFTNIDMETIENYRVVVKDLQLLAPSYNYMKEVQPTWDRTNIIRELSDSINIDQTVYSA